MKRFISCYTHTDGSQWVGPDYHAETFEEAQALAMDYPIQPITIIGEHLESVLTENLDIETQYHRAPSGRIH